MLVIRVPGEPRGKGRPRFTRHGGGRAFTDAKTLNYEAVVRLYADQARKDAGHPLIAEGGIEVTVEAVFSMPKTMTKRNRQLVAEGLLRPTRRPDADNVLKILDALNGVIWKDDAQLTEVIFRKLYGDEPELRIAVQPMSLTFDAITEAA